MRVVVYTAIMVNNPESDKPIDAPTYFNKISEFDYILITNLKNGKEIFKTSGWQDIRIMEPPEDEMPIRTKYGWQIYASRWFKWHPDKIFSDYDISIWVDGWQAPDYNKKNLWYEIIENLSNNNKYNIIHDLHNKNKCIYDEHESIIFCKKDSYANILKVTKYVKTMGCPKKLGLFWTGCFIYKIGSKDIQQIFNDLWKDMILYTYRDQALLTYEIWKNNALPLWGTAPLYNMVIPVDTDRNHIYI